MRDSTKKLIANYEERIALMKLEDGVVQFERRNGFHPEWTTCADPTSPLWPDTNYFEYRVKPKPIELWVWKYPSSGLMCQDFYNKKQPDDTGPTGRVMILMREVTE